MKRKSKILLEMKAQPDQTSCGPTCLYALYQHLGVKISLKKVLDEVQQFSIGGGTLGVILGKHALMLNLSVTLYSYNLRVFDPSWFQFDRNQLIRKLDLRLKSKKNSQKLAMAIRSYRDFIMAGGEVRFDNLSAKLLKKFLTTNSPILTGLSSTWLYQAQREDPITTEDDDIGGDPAGHFVLLHGYNSKTKKVSVADPYRPNPIAGKHYYEIPIDRMITSILLGVMTYDGNLLIIKRKNET